ncbi:hypothetical protein MBLNU459_g7090t1 [Dothideomycetes sp. NU459]
MDDDNRARQASELTLLSTMYPSEFSWRSDPPPDLERPDFPDPSFALTLDPSYTLEITLPPDYPSDGKPNAYLSCAGHVDTAHRKSARAALSKIVVDQESGVEILDLIVTAFVQSLPGLAPLESAEPVSTAGSGKMSDQHAGTRRQPSHAIKRVVIWSHHLLATSKRRDIQVWSKELNLSGFARPGYPGAVFAEGDEDQVDEFVGRLKQLRWQALQVRAEEKVDARVCGNGEGVEEVEGLGDIAEALKKKDPECAKMFLEGMKIAPSHG